MRDPSETSLAGGSASERRRARVEQAAHGGTVPEHERTHAGAAATGPADPGAALSLSGIVAGYGDAEVLHGVTVNLYVGKVLGIRPKRINEFRNLDQGLWQGLQLDEIKRRIVK